MPSMAIMELKNSPCEIGDFSNAFDKWIKFAPKESH